MTSSAFLISCSDHYHHRMHLWDKCLRSMGYTTQYITSDFDHTAKQPFTCTVPNCIQLPVRPYRKNLSVDRIVSHGMFARSVKAYVEKHNPKVIVALLPPNFLAHYLTKYKQKHPDTVLIYDIFDLWPETFPSSGAKKLLAPAFSVWADLRDRNLWAADHVTTECDLFRQKLRLPENTASTVRLCAEPLSAPGEPRLDENRLELCYLGAINNVIGIADISRLLQEVCAQRAVSVHIIGKGEHQQEFIDSLKATGADVIYHGPVYDPIKKAQIMERCHFGLNIMKSSVCVGLTMKSVDYFRFGLPIINNIPADTACMVEQFGIGLPLDDGCAQSLISMDNRRCLEMRGNVQALFAGHFTEASVLDKMNDILKSILR